MPIGNTTYTPWIAPTDDAHPALFDGECGHTVGQVVALARACGFDPASLFPCRDAAPIRSSRPRQPPPD